MFINVSTYHLQLNHSGISSLLQITMTVFFISTNLLIEEGFGKYSGSHLPHVGGIPLAILSYCGTVVGLFIAEMKI